MICDLVAMVFMTLCVHCTLTHAPHLYPIHPSSMPVIPNQPNQSKCHEFLSHSHTCVHNFTNYCSFVIERVLHIHLIILIGNRYLHLSYLILLCNSISPTHSYHINPSILVHHSLIRSFHSPPYLMH
jgi:hypothetical protein